MNLSELPLEFRAEPRVFAAVESRHITDDGACVSCPVMAFALEALRVAGPADLLTTLNAGEQLCDWERWLDYARREWAKTLEHFDEVRRALGRSMLAAENLRRAEDLENKLFLLLDEAMRVRAERDARLTSANDFLGVAS